MTIARLADAARRDGRAGFVEQRDLAELAELEDVVLEDAGPAAGCSRPVFCRSADSAFSSAALLTT